MFLATHSTEIINDASPGDILMVKKGSRGAKRVTDEKAYRELFQYLGSSENAEFARVARASRIVFFEGNDKRILRKFAGKLSVGQFVEDTDTVIVRAGGFGQWRKVSHTKWALSELFDMNVSIAALFDRDYRCDEEVNSFLGENDDEEICCRVLERKEIENYCLTVSSLTRAIKKRGMQRGAEISEDEIYNLLLRISDEMKIDIQSNRSGQRVTYARSIGSKDSDNSTVRSELVAFEKSWQALEGRFLMLPSKNFISKLSKSLQDSFGFGLTIFSLIDEMRVDEIADDLKCLLADFDKALSSTKV